MKNVCKSHRCVSCCYDTEMPLLDEDVKRIIGLGFKEQYFAARSKGFKVLKNSSEGRCVFHDGKQCTIYENRPAGCKLYPIIFDEDLSLPVRDELCPYRNEFGLSAKAKKELTEVYVNLISERGARKS
ncbi:MAG: YkgJ family cysteine cluster protein [Nitrososphaerales archaeon]